MNQRSHSKSLLPDVKNAPVTLEFHNLVQDFDVFWRQEQKATASDQIEAFRKKIVPRFPQFYFYKINSWRQQEAAPEQILSDELKVYPDYRDRFLNAGTKLPIYLSKALESFQKHFPDFHGKISVYIIHSFDEMDGGTRDLEGKNYFIFGAESIAKHHSSQDFERKIPFLQHELFHIYHRNFFQERESLVDGLWAEGLAVLVAKELNPNADLAQLSLDNPKGLLGQCTNLKARLIADVKERIKAPKTDDYGTYFFGSSKHPWIPKRAGYCLGFEIAKEARKKKTLYELARFDRASIKKTIDDYLSNP